MSQRNTVINQFLKLMPRAEFSKLSASHHNGQRFRKFTRYDQFVLLLTLQVTGRTSIRDVVGTEGSGKKTPSNWLPDHVEEDF